MKKIVLFMSFILAFQVCYRMNLVFSQKNTDTEEIEKVIKEFVQAYVRNDITSVLHFISANYSEGGGTNDYEVAKRKIEAEMARNSKGYIDSSAQITRLDIIELDVKNNKAVVNYETDFKALSLDDLKEHHIKPNVTIHLVKENGAWKIAAINRKLPVVQLNR